LKSDEMNLDRRQLVGGFLCRKARKPRTNLLLERKRQWVRGWMLEH